MQDFFWNTNDTDFSSGVFAGTQYFFFDVLLRFVDNFFDTTRVNTAIFHEHFNSLAGDFAAVCARPDPAQVTRFQNMLLKRGMGRLELSAEIRHESQLAVTFTGRYVAQLVK